MQIAATMTSSPPNATSYPVTVATTDPPNQACYLLNSTASVQLSYNSYLVATLIFVFVGLVGNALSMIVFSSAPMRSFSSNVYLLTLAVSDSFYLIGYVIHCESKNLPLRFSDIFSQTVGNFQSKFYTPIIRSYLR